MGAYNVIITKQAERHLSVIYNYIATELAAEGLAKALLAVLFYEMDKLCDNPRNSQIVKDAPWCDYGIRKIEVKRYLIYFYIDEIRQEIGILAIIFKSKIEQDELCVPSFAEHECCHQQIMQFSQKKKRNSGKF